MLNGISGLIAAIAGLVTSVTGLIGMIVVARRTSVRERDDAATHAAERALTPPPPTEVGDAEALVEIQQARKRRRRRDRRTAN